MKKLVVLLLATAMVLSCVACGNGGTTNTENKENTENNVTNTEDNTQQTGEIADAADLLVKVWDEYKEVGSDDVQFSIGGGDAANMVMDAPGKYDVTTEGGLDGLVFQYCVPETAIEKADDFATGIHMMMANNFTTVGLHVTDAADVESVVADIKDATLNNQWMCGMPERFIVVTVNENYVIAAFGIEMIIDVYEEAITNVYGDAAVIVVDEMLVR